MAFFSLIMLSTLLYFFTPPLPLLGEGVGG